MGWRGLTPVRIRCLGCGQRIPAGSRRSRCARCLRERDARFDLDPAVRRAVLVRDHYRCRIRGPGCKGRATEVDHIDPRGSRTDQLNMQAACKVCNSRKRDGR